MLGLQTGQDEPFARVMRWARVTAGVLVFAMLLRGTVPPTGAPTLLTAALLFSGQMFLLNAYSLWRSRAGDNSERRQTTEVALELVAAVVTATTIHHLAIFEVTPSYLMVACIHAGLRLGLRRGVALVTPAVVALVTLRAVGVPSWVVPAQVDGADLGLIAPPVMGLLLLTAVSGLAVDTLRAAEVRADAARDRAEVANATLRRTNAALQRFARTIAHDLRAPLSSAAGSAELLRDLGNRLQPEQLHDVTDTLANSARRAAELVTDMLEVAEGAQQRPVIVSDLRAWLLTLLGPSLAERDGTLEITATESSFPVPAGPVRAVLLNLVTNALKHRDADGDDPTIEVSLDLDGAHLRIRVDDDGPGIPASRRDDVLRPGVRGGTTDTTGTGHGLTEVHRTVTEELAGTLSIDDSSLGGTRVTVLLPLTSDDTSPLGPTAS